LPPDGESGLAKWCFTAGDVEIELMQTCRTDGTHAYRTIGRKVWDDEGILEMIRRLKE